ncbi:tetratricopeptide repeat protein [Plasticicumulans acidivorans]|uniref:Uncharacterized protein n=1 Tax=Plasticicumulans acidivorans TaxID=886464 RepID=A0A317MTS6_9GAMM|nr:hypothetical protein [Plasticicumulans acidivorans]PWV61118.1 hypothetical protein C7443_106132 [Plasticicumulans acidivorans]
MSTYIYKPIIESAKKLALLCGLCLFTNVSFAAKNCDALLKDTRFDHTKFNDYRQHVNSGNPAPPYLGRSNLLWLVEKTHLDPFLNDPSGLQKNFTSDLLYTLQMFPNDYKALNVLIEYAENYGGEFPNPNKTPSMPDVDCLFETAVKKAPNDPIVRQLFGVRKFRRGDYEAAIENFDEANRLGLRSAELDYNLGLSYFKVGQLDKAKEYAKQAYAKGYPLLGLKKKLIEAKYWP